MRTLAIVGDTIGACDYYRATGPLYEMSLQGHPYSAMTAADVMQLMSKGIELQKYYDILQISRAAYSEESQGALSKVPLYLRSLGMSVIVDYDDDFTNQFRKVHDGTLGDLQDFSAIIVSTPHLKKMMQPYNKNVQIVRNLVAPELFKGFNRLIPNLTIGLTGSVTHRTDWQVVVEPLLEVLAENPDVRLFLSGHIPERLAGHPQVLTVSQLLHQEGVKDDDNFIPLKYYGFIMRNIDILLTPVDPADRFNWSKSDIKALEGQIAERPVGDRQIGGAAVIASDGIPNYQEAVLHERTGLLVNHTDQAGWKEAISFAVKNSDWREKLQAAGYQHCNRLFTYKARLAERIFAYQSVIDSDRKSISRVRARVAALVTAGSN